MVIRGWYMGEGDAEAIKEGICSIVEYCVILDVSLPSEEVQKGYKFPWDTGDAKWFRFGILTCRSMSPENGGYQ